MTDPSGSGTDGQRRVPGPWVIVLGMHRAGTSAITGALAALGMALPPEQDLVRGRPDNPVHYESEALIALNDRILETMGGWWNAPPEVEPGWATSRAASAWTEEARSTLSQIFPGTGPRVWKDPRNCVLLPFWRRLLEDPVGVVLVWRSPLAVAASLHERDGSTIAQGLALWEHYNRSALDAVVGLPGYVVSNEDLIQDPRTVMTAIAGWLDDIGIASRGSGVWETQAAAQQVSPNLSHHGTDDVGGLLPGQIEVMDQLRALDGPHAVMTAVDLDPPSPWTLDTLAAARMLRITVARQVTLADGTRKLSDAHQELIAAYRDQIAVSDNRLEHIQNLQQIADDRMERIEKMDIETHRLEGDVARLQKENEELVDNRNAWQDKAEDAADEVRQMQTSSSWRLTAPLRSARNVVGKPDKPDGTAK